MNEKEELWFKTINCYTKVLLDPKNKNETNKIILLLSFSVHYDTWCLTRFTKCVIGKQEVILCK